MQVDTETLLATSVFHSNSHDQIMAVVSKFSHSQNNK